MSGTISIGSAPARFPTRASRLTRIAAERTATSDAAVKPEKVLVDRERLLATEGGRSRFFDLLDLVLGPKPRFLLGAALLAGCLLCVHQNGVFDFEKHAKLISDAAKAAVEKGDLDTLKQQATKAAQAVQKDLKTAAATAKTKDELQTVEIPVVPELLRKLVSSYGAGVAGLLLILSSFFAGWKMTLFALPAAAIPVLFSQLTFFQIGTLSPSLVPSVLGVAVFVVGVLFGRSRRE